MTAPDLGSTDAAGSDEISLLALGTVVLRWRRVVIAAILVGGLIGVARGLLSSRVYESSAQFLPQGAEAPQSGLAAAASQFGIRVPSSGGAWTPAMYVELLKSRTLLEPIVRDTIHVAESNRSIPMLELLEIAPGTPQRREYLGVRKLAGMISAEEVRSITAVRVAARTPFPSVSHALVDRLVSGVNRFNLQTRKSQASAERQFVESLAQQAESTLRVAEDRQALFHARNKVIAGESDLALERDRHRRDVDRLQGVYGSLLQDREEARIREVRDAPVITILEQPSFPVVPLSRGTLTKGAMGGIVGAGLALLLAFITEGVAGARRQQTDEAREFFRVADSVVPRVFRRGSR